MGVSLKQKYRMTFKCTSCDEVFKKITVNPDLKSAPCPACKKKDKSTKFVRLGDGPVGDADIAASKAEFKPRPNVIYKCNDCLSVLRVHEDVGSKSLSSCPLCESSDISYIEHTGSQKISDHSKTQIKAVDETSRIVMDDYKMGDLKDRVYEGEAMAPQLTPKLQAQADSFFGGSGNAARKKLGINTSAMARRAMAGAYSPNRTGAVDPVAMQHRAKATVPTKIIASTDGKS